MTSAHLAWSHSRRKAFKDCPKAFYHMNVAPRGHPDRVEFVQSQAMKDGNEIDEALTARISMGTPLPSKFQQWEGLASTVVSAPGQKITQMKIAFDTAFKTCGYTEWDKVYLRVIYDLALLVNPKHALLWDWKNGMVWPDESQLKLFAATGFMYFPEVEVIDTSYVWLKHGITSDARYTRDQLPEMMAELLPDVERMQVMYRAWREDPAFQWPPTPAKQACKFCPVKTCPVRFKS
jgi:hypothetical protein